MENKKMNKLNDHILRTDAKITHELSDNIGKEHASELMKNEMAKILAKEILKIFPVECIKNVLCDEYSTEVIVLSKFDLHQILLEYEDMTETERRIIKMQLIEPELRDKLYNQQFDNELKFRI